MDERSHERWSNAMKESITLKGVIDEDFVNYQLPAMYLAFPKCNLKCGVENCQNSVLANEPDITVSISNLYNRYIKNPITEAVICSGMDPMDSWGELDSLLCYFRHKMGCTDDFVIYTGYDKDEITEKVDHISLEYSNVVVKYGRYIPGDVPHYDSVLGVKLASDNQYAERLS